MKIKGEMNFSQNEFERRKKKPVEKYAAMMWCDEMDVEFSMCWRCVCDGDTMVVAEQKQFTTSKWWKWH